MTIKKQFKKKPDPERDAAFKSLPLSVKQSLSEEDIEDFLYSEVWPEALFKKLKEFIHTI